MNENAKAFKFPRRGRAPSLSCPVMQFAVLRAVRYNAEKSRLTRDIQ